MEHGEINLLHCMIYMGIIGALVIMFAYPDMSKRRKVMHGSRSFAVEVGRVSNSISVTICFTNLQGISTNWQGTCAFGTYIMKSVTTEAYCSLY